MLDKQESARRWARVCDAVDAGRIDEALVCFEEWEALERLSQEELVHKGRLIQLGSESSVYELADAKQALVDALGRRGDYPEALVELGHFSWVVEDDAPEGLKYFDRAVTVLEKLLAEAEEGRQKCLEELRDSANGRPR